MANLSPSDEKPVCDVCGAFEAREFGGRHLCDDCYAGAGSCCPGWGDAEDEKACGGAGPDKQGA